MLVGEASQTVYVEGKVHTLAHGIGSILHLEYRAEDGEMRLFRRNHAVAISDVEVGCIPARLLLQRDAQVGYCDPQQTIVSNDVQLSRIPNRKITKN